MTLTRRSLVALAASAVAFPVHATTPPVFERRGAAIRGYDPVAYFTEEKPVRGSRDIEVEWNGAVWRFASIENRSVFLSDPEKYAPKYGGYCAWAVANNYTASTDPDAWTIHEGRLYLNYSLRVRDQWLKDILGDIVRGDANWPAVLSN